LNGGEICLSTGEKQKASNKAEKIIVSRNGPYLVSGALPLAKAVIINDESGDAQKWSVTKEFSVPDTYALCRCGQSKNKPFCDGTHARVDFDGSETASREPYSKRAEVESGLGIGLSDVQSLCAGSRFCHRKGGIWRLLEKSTDPKIRQIIIEEACNCASGRLVAVDRETGKPLEPVLKKAIHLVEDPKKGLSGPLRVTGGVTVKSQNGRRYETRNRVTLCRCGESKSKPFCDASHVSTRFKAKYKTRKD
jgi:CDGSH-type Zn-finger protein